MNHTLFPCPLCPDDTNVDATRFRRTRTTTPNNITRRFHVTYLLTLRTPLYHHGVHNNSTRHKLQSSLGSKQKKNTDGYREPCSSLYYIFLPLPLSLSLPSSVICLWSHSRRDIWKTRRLHTSPAQSTSKKITTTSTPI